MRVYGWPAAGKRQRKAPLPVHSLHDESSIRRRFTSNLFPLPRARGGRRQQRHQPQRRAHALGKDTTRNLVTFSWWSSVWCVERNLNDQWPTSAVAASFWVAAPLLLLLLPKTSTSIKGSHSIDSRSSDSQKLLWNPFSLPSVTFLELDHQLLWSNRTEVVRIYTYTYVHRTVPPTFQRNFWP